MTTITKQELHATIAVRHCNEHYFILDAYYVGNKIGSLTLSLTKSFNSATLSSVDVAEPYQRHGVATKMLLRAKRFLVLNRYRSLGASCEGSGTVQLLERIFGEGNTRYFHGNRQIPYVEAVEVMDVQFGYIRAITNIV